VARAAAAAGWRSTRPVSEDQNPPPRRRARRGSRIRPASILVPSRVKTAGSAVTEPATAQAMTAIVPAAMPLSICSPGRNMPVTAMAKMLPEMTTVRPEVRKVVSSAWRGVAPACRSWRERAT